MLISTPYRLRVLLLALAIVFPLGGGMARAEQYCKKGEKVCEHKLATFCENQTCSSVQTEQKCVPANQDCDAFWCGNRQCQSSWLLSKDVCCIYYPSDSEAQYTCSTSELSCPGNTARLTIRPPTLASADLD
jgi:hypothetical protein